MDGYLKKVSSESVVQQIIDSLTDAMIRGQLKPGDRIPTEVELAKALGVGRNSVREAIKILVYLGVLEIKRAEGTFVCRGFSESMIDPMIYGIILEGQGSYEQLMELRQIMEIGVVEMAVLRHTPADIETLKAALMSFRAEIEKGYQNAEAVFWSDEHFNDCLSAIAKNPMVDKVIRVVRVLTHANRLKNVERVLREGRGNELYETRRRICELIENGDKAPVKEAVTKTYHV